MTSRRVPYFSQWESRELTEDVIARGAAVALAEDPKWASSGAGTAEEYARWADNLCGMACLKMILAARTGRDLAMMELARQCTDHGGYTVSSTGEIKGLIYAPFVQFVRQQFGIESRVVTGIAATDVAGVLREAEFFVASVHHTIRWPEREPPMRGGHLVLVLEATAGEIVFHNPSGHTVTAQEYARVPVATFDKFFAGRGIAIKAQT